MRRTLLLFASLLLLSACGMHAPEKSRYAMRYSAQFRPATGDALVTITTTPGTGRLIELDFDMPAAVYQDAIGDGSVEREGDRVRWMPSSMGGSFQYRVVINHQRDNGQYDSLMMPDWVITRGDRLFPPAAVRASKGSGSTSRLELALPSGWKHIETPYIKLTGGEFAVSNPRRKFDRPVGWMAAGALSSSREAIASTRVTLTVPEGQHTDRLATMAILRQTLPEYDKAFGGLPRKLLIVRSGDPMWRGGLSAPGSLWLQADRPLISANGTSPPLHELAHVITGVVGGPNDDWISEGLAEYYSLEIGRRAKLISDDRFAKSIRNAEKSGAKVASLKAAESSRDRTRKAVALFANLDTELHAAGSSLDALTRLLMHRETVTADELRADAKKLEGHPSKVLAQAG